MMIALGINSGKRIILLSSNGNTVNSQSCTNAWLKLSGVLRQTVDFMDESHEPPWMDSRRVWRSIPEG